MTDESIFAAALAIGSPADRAAYLDRACANNPRLRAEVEELLAAHAASNPLDRPPADLARTGAYQPEEDGPPPAAVGDRIGPYRLMEPIGEGGFGLVFVAEQAEPVRRKVALKVLKPGMDTREVVARFEAERQALALMDHPNIARVLDAGSTPQGRPYFVMELVRGLPITDYCDQQKLPPRDRLALFVQVCQAVQHAHQKGVIHRDLKPSNVLVAPHDGVPVVKVIDFGVAKAVGQSLTDKTIYTRFAQVIGTPLYMSPEQAEVNQLDVDTRADVYALGVLLYELLTGTTPFDRDRFRKAAFDEIRRIIREEEPPRLSTRLTSLGATLTAVSASRGTEPGKLAGLVRGELDWIVMKCLEKDRNRRYDSATGLAKDVQRYLTGDAVEACPPTLGYRLRKFYRRNQAAIVTTVASVIFLTATNLVIVWQAFRAIDAEVEATGQRREADRQRDEARRQRDEADAARARVAEEERAVRGLLAESEGHRRADELRLASAEVDADLALLDWGEIPTGLVRLARTLQRLPPNARQLREFVAMTLIARGQKLAPLLPPFLSGGEAVESAALAPDGRTILTAGGPGRLWDTRTGRLLATLRENDEVAVRAVLSRDGRVAATTAADGVVRFWDVPSGRFRARTSPVGSVGVEPEEGKRPDWLLLNEDGRRFVAAVPAGGGQKRWAVTVWDTTTGRLLGDLSHAGGRPRAVALSPDGRRVVTCERGEPVRVWSADDGTQLQALDRHDAERQGVAFSPSGRPAATRDGGTLRWWDATSWRSEGSLRWPGDSPPGVTGPMRYESEDLVEWDYAPVRGRAGVDHLPVEVIRHGAREWPGLIYIPASDRRRNWSNLRLDGEILLAGTWAYDARTRRPLYPPPGKWYHPALTRFAHDGRWLPVSGTLVDLAVDKPVRVPWLDPPAVVIPGVGFVGASWVWWNNDESYTATAAWVPLPSRLPPDDLLVLWVHVTARGELGPDGGFVKWDEATWEKKRQELAARPVPFPDFPFPGNIATDRLHWLRRELDDMEGDPARTRPVIRELARRAAAGDADEATYWRGQLDWLSPEVAPPPREVKR